MFEPSAAQIFLDLTHDEAWQPSGLFGSLAERRPVRLDRAIEHRFFRAVALVAAPRPMRSVRECGPHATCAWPTSCRRRSPACSALSRYWNAAAARQAPAAATRTSQARPVARAPPRARARSTQAPPVATAEQQPARPTGNLDTRTSLEVLELLQRAPSESTIACPRALHRARARSQARRPRSRPHRRPRAEPREHWRFQDEAPRVASRGSC